MPPMNGMPPNNHGNMHGPNGGVPNHGSMSNGRNTPNDYNPNGYHPAYRYGGDQGYQQQEMKPPMPPNGPQGQQMPFSQNYPSFEDRENQGSLSMNQGAPGSGPGHHMSNMNYPNKPFQQHGQPNMNDGPGMMNQGQGPMNRASPVQDYIPPTKPDYMNNSNNNPNAPIPPPPQPPYMQRDQGYNGHHGPQHSFNRGPPRDGYNSGPHSMNGPNGYGGGNMPPFYSNHNNHNNRHP